MGEHRPKTAYLLAGDTDSEFWQIALKEGCYKILYPFESRGIIRFEESFRKAAS